MEYHSTELREDDQCVVTGLQYPLEPEWVQWIDVEGLGDGTALAELCERLEFHPLALADAQNIGQRPKVEPYEDFHFLALRAFLLDEEGHLEWTQVSLFLREGLLLTVHEPGLTGLSGIRDRLHRGRVAIRSGGADYLAIMILDAVVDGYFPILEEYGDRLDDLEDRVLDGQDHEVLSEIYGIRRDLALFRRSAWPMREVLHSLSKSGDSPVREQHQLHLRDTLDHLTQTLEVIESYRDLAASLVDAHLNLVGQRTNEVMKVLTIVSTIFIPLTFIAGIYGMNFDTTEPWNLPELHWRFGYLAFWVVNVVLVVGLLALFRKLGWLGRKS
ncbi:MAG: magnesium/cobalt transporter CorA [Planctomycetota bacterium]